MANDKLNEPVIIAARQIEARSLPVGFTPAYTEYVIRQSSDLGNVAGKANEAGQGAYDAQVKNDEQDEELADHESRIAKAEATLGDHELRITAAEAELADHETRITANEAELADHEARIDSAEAELADHESRITANRSDIDSLLADVADHETRITQNEADIVALKYATTRKKSEVVYSGVSLVIPTSSTNLITILKALTPTSGTLLPFFNTTTDKLTVYNENKTLDFKLSLIGSWPGGTANRSIQLTFSGAVPDTLVASRNVATVTDNVLLATFFSVDQGGFLATNGSTITIQSNGAAFTATTIKIIAEQ